MLNPRRLPGLRGFSLSNYTLSCTFRYGGLI
nr:MAG TPA: hypothetical protein [Caudoviricetes sp.]DAS84377.1 MAG TPA: hypothetical protein [Caudoviricetes sp.]